MAAREVFHEGEIRLQERTGERGMALRNGAMIGSTIMGGAVPFLATLRTLAVATHDGSGRLWASLWVDWPGFVDSDDEGSSVRIDVSRAASADDPVVRLCEEGQPLGLLGIELETRKRLRINGTVRTRRDAELELEVGEAFPNCPKYIQRRHLTQQAAASGSAPSLRGKQLDEARCAFVARADTVFVASRHPEHGVDVSHRGGEPGFVHVEGTGGLRFPDYQGNGMYMTLGNLEVHPRAGAVFVDFAASRLLAVTGRTEIHHDAEDPRHPTGGTARYWSLHVEEWLEFALPARLDWALLDRSRFNPPASAETP
jgi:predicted pyridoxine 5'-phosphate oxidase superfamily flavin-nucleotide-binding protein